MMNLARSHMTIFSSAYKSQMMVKVKSVNSVKYQSVTIKMKQRGIFYFVLGQFFFISSDILL